MVVESFNVYNIKLKQPAGFYLPNGERVRQFKSKMGKANFSINKFPERDLKEDELIMMTICSYHQLNTTIS